MKRSGGLRMQRTPIDGGPDRPPRWRDAGADRCGFCLHRFALEIEYRCDDCDRAVCAVCIVRMSVSDSRHCPDCVTPGAG